MSIHFVQGQAAVTAIRFSPAPLPDLINSTEGLSITLNKIKGLTFFGNVFIK
jgi:hypothetical protein